MSLFRRRLLLVALSLSLIALSSLTGRNGQAAYTVPGGEPAELFVDSPQKSVSSGFDFANLDKTASACQDFNRFANGGWIDKNQIPPAYSRWGRFEVLGEQNLD
ncbi:MAG TPA: hypothetical protein VJT09_19655, partial [Pyrinomonadaceae bacterium]|nr:hypothetical protein [Pyrinomonadaceae bacterium]